MADTSEQQQSFPRRGDSGRIDRLPDLLAIILVGLLVGLAALCLYDLVFWAIGYGRFGRASGWLALVLPLWLLVEDYRAWKGVPGRGAVAILSAAVGLALGLLAASLTSALPPLASGGVGATVAAACYGLAWYAGTRYCARHFGEG
jgi:hypothetical protein